MAPGAELRLATDIPDYVEHALAAVAASPDFRLLPGSDIRWSLPWPDWPGTRYEAKALAAGRTAALPELPAASEPRPWTGPVADPVRRAANPD